MLPFLGRVCGVSPQGQTLKKGQEGGYLFSRVSREKASSLLPSSCLSIPRTARWMCFNRFRADKILFIFGC